MLHAGPRVLVTNLRSTRHPPCTNPLASLPRTPARAIFVRPAPPHATPNQTPRAPQSNASSAQSDTVDTEQTAAPNDTPRPGTELGTRDERIAFRRVRLVDPRTGALRPLAALSDIRSELLSDKEVRRRYSLVLVANAPDPVVRLVNMGEQYRKAREQKQKARESAKFLGEKEIQLTWDTASLDHQRKLDQARESLLDGMRVSLVHAPKRGVRHALTAEEMQERAQGTVDALAEVGKEWRPKEIGPRITVIHLDGLQQQSVQQQQVTIPLGAAPHILQRRIVDVQQALATGKKVKVQFAGEKRAKSKKGSTEDSLVSKFLFKDEKEEQKPEKWTRKKKDAFVESVVGKLVGQDVQEWKTRDDWNVSTTLYLTRTSTNAD